MTTWPEGPLEQRYEIYTGEWLDVTDDVRVGDDTTITRGRPDEASQPDPGTAELVIDNRTGRYSPRNPMSDLFGLIGRNTPLRVAVRGPASYLRVPDVLSSRASTASGAALAVTDLDVRVELALDRLPAQADDGLPAPGAHTLQEVIGRYSSTGDSRMWYLLMGVLGAPAVGWSTTGTFEDVRVITATEAVPYTSGQRFAVRATLDVDNGAGGHTAAFYTAPSLAGPWRQLGEPVVTAGTTVINQTGTADLQIGDVSNLTAERAVGRYYAAEVRNGIGGTVVANPDFTTQTPGTTSWTDSAGRLWQVEGEAEITDYYRRVHHEIPSWPPRWDTSGADIGVTVAAAGILRRLGQGQKALQSTLRRRIPSYSPRAYWPFEEDREATQAYSPIEGVAPMVVRDVEFASDDSLGGSAALPAWNAGARADGTVPAGSTSPQWQVECVYQLDALPTTESTLLLVTTTGLDYIIRLTDGIVRVYSIDDDDVWTMRINGSAGTAFTGAWNRLQLFVTQNGSSIDLHLGWITIGSGAIGFDTSFTGAFGQVRTLRARGAGTGLRLGHLAVFDTISNTPFNSADHGFTGEGAPARMRRLAEEEGLPISVSGFSASSVAMGPQRPATLLDLIQECAEADGGILAERRDAPGLQYQPRYLRYNQAPVLELDYEAGHIAPPLEPVDDDLDVRNDVTVSRTGGSSARAVLEDGPLSVLPPPDGIGVYDDSTEVNIAADEDLEGIAWWRLHLGTVDEMRYPRVTLNLRNAAVQPLLQDYLDRLDVGARITIANPPPWLPPDTIDLIVQSYTETISQYAWTVELTCTPARPWIVGEVAAVTPGEETGPTRVDTDGTQLYGAADADDTALDVAATVGPDWATTAGPTPTGVASDLPVDVRIGGEVMTVTAIQPRAWDVFSRTVSNSWGTSTSGHVWTGAGGSSSERSVNGSQGVITLSSTPTNLRAEQQLISLADCELLVTITPSQLATGAAFLPGILLRAATDYYSCRLVLGTGGTVGMEVTRSGVVVGTATTTPYTYAAGTALRLRARVDGHQVRGRVWPAGSVEPAVWHVDQTVVTGTIASGAVGVIVLAASGNTNASPQFSHDDFEIARPQRWTVTRSVNGITKSHAAGADVRLAEPMIVAL